jgi:hypothetical protein
LAPVFGQQYQFERGNQTNALAALYGAGNTTAGLLSNLDQTRLGNMGQGVNAANAALAAQGWGPQALLAAESQRTGIPINILAQLSGIVGPLANVGGTTNSTTTTPGQQTNWGQLAVGAGIAGLGAFTGNPMMMAQGAGMGLNGAFGSPGGSGSAATGYYATPQFATNQQNPATWIPAPYGRV